MKGKRTPEQRELLGQAFIEKSKSLYPNELTYENVEYRNETTPVVLTCIEHGEFTAIPKSHLKRGKCCAECAKHSYKMKKGTKRDVFLDLAARVHGIKYKYLSLPPIFNNKDEITIVCPEHGEFTQLVGAHKDGRGCRACGYMRAGGSGSYNSTTICRLSDIPDVNIYVLRLNNEEEDFIKVGITAKTAKRRASSIKPYATEVISEVVMKLDDAYELEQFILSEAGSYRPNKRFTGHTECFNSSNTKLFMEALTAP